MSTDLWTWMMWVLGSGHRDRCQGWSWCRVVPDWRPDTEVLRALLCCAIGNRTRYLLARSASCFRCDMAAGGDSTKNRRSPDAMVDFRPFKNGPKIQLRYAQMMSHFFCPSQFQKREAPSNCRFWGSKTDTFHRGKSAQKCPTE